MAANNGKGIAGALPLWAQRVRLYRERRDLSQHELATRAGIGEATLRAVEHGGNTTIDTLTALCDGLSIPLYELFKPNDVRSRTEHELEELGRSIYQRICEEAGLQDTIDTVLYEFNTRIRQREDQRRR